MKPAPLLMVPFREVRHDQPDECLHYESVAVRGQEMDWTIPAHRHDGLHQFQLLERGAVSGTIDGRPFEAQGPAMLMLAPGAVHGFRYSRGSVGHQVTIPTATLLRLLGDTSLATTELGASFVLPRQDKRIARACADCFEALAREFHGASVGRVQALLAHATLLAVLFLRQRGQQPETGKSKGLPDTLVQRYRALLETSFRAHQPLSFYAEALGVTPDHLSRICRKVTGLSALDLAHERLMLEARRLLAYTAMPVSEVAHQLGYEDPAYFTKFFARRVGDTPSAYRVAVATGVRSALAQPLPASG